MARLSVRELVCAEVLVGRGRSVRSVARELGVDESTLRYRLQRRADGSVDGRTQQPAALPAPMRVAAEPLVEAVDPENWTGPLSGRRYASREGFRMKRKRRYRSPESKAKVALEAARDEKTIAELSREYGVHANLLTP